MLRAQLLKSRVETLELLLNRVFVLAVQLFDYGSGIDGTGLVGRGPGTAVRVLDVHQGGAGFTPRVEVCACAFLAPGFGFVGRVGGGEEEGDVGGADHAIYDGDVVGHEDSKDCLLEDGAGFGFEAGEESFHGVQDVVSQEFVAVGTDVKFYAWQRGSGVVVC